MQILINISEGHYTTLQRMRDVGLGYYNNAILNGKVLSEDVTNGDVFKAVFPNGTEEQHGLFIFYNVNGICIQFMLDWWDAPYKAESEDVKR